jgi:hypothetical protein
MMVKLNIDYSKNSGVPPTWDIANRTFHEWWNAEKFDWNDSYILTKYCSDKFDIWWDSEKFNWDYSWTLAARCSEHFEKWWDPKKFNWSNSQTLIEYCQEYKDIWGHEYMYHQIAL